MTLDVRYNNNQIKESDTANFLGITVDNHCNWKNQVDKVCNKLMKFVYVLRRLRNMSAWNTILMAYHGHVSSILRYGLPIWGNSCDIHRAFIAQKKCLRAMCGISPRESCKPLFRKHGILTLSCMYIFEASVFVKKHPELFKSAKDVYPRNTRYPDKLVLHFIPNSALFMKGSYYMCMRIFNATPDSIKSLPFRQFKTQLHRWLKERMFYTVDELFEA
jgi:hypothetical protein